MDIEIGAAKGWSGRTENSCLDRLPCRDAYADTELESGRASCAPEARQIKPVSGVSAP